MSKEVQTFEKMLQDIKNIISQYEHVKSKQKQYIHYHVFHSQGNCFGFSEMIKETNNICDDYFYFEIQKPFSMFGLSSIKQCNPAKFNSNSVYAVARYVYGEWIARQMKWNLIQMFEHDSNNEMKEEINQQKKQYWSIMDNITMSQPDHSSTLYSDKNYFQINYYESIHVSFGKSLCFPIENTPIKQKLQISMSYGYVTQNEFNIPIKMNIPIQLNQNGFIKINQDDVIKNASKIWIQFLVNRQEWNQYSEYLLKNFPK